MNDKQILDTLGLGYADVGRMLGCDRQKVRQQIMREAGFFTLDRLKEMYEHLHEHRRWETLNRLEPILKQRGGALWELERPLPELSSEPWRRLLCLFSDSGWVAPVLGLLGEDLRPSALERQVELMLPRRKEAELKELCRSRLPGRYRLSLHQAEIPALLGALVVLVQADGEVRLLLPGDQGLQPLPPRLASAQHAAVEQLHAASKDVIHATIDGLIVGQRRKAAAGADRLAIDFPVAGRDAFRLELERVSGLGWTARFAPLPGAPEVIGVRLREPGGRVLIEAPGSHLPWQGAWPERSPDSDWKELTLEILEPDHE